jgi:uncharacterized membrane protein
MGDDTAERLERLEEKVDELLRRVANLEAATPPSRADRTQAVGAPLQPAARAAPTAREASQAADQPRDRGRSQLDLEDLLGGRVLGWIGGSAIVLGAVFFLVMAVGRGWIDEPTRIVLAFLGSALLFGAGLYLYERKGQTQAALAAVASAIAAFYASVTAATQLYDLIAPALGLAVAVVIGAAATAIAVRWNSRVVAGVGIVGALLAPVLVDAGTSTVALAFMAIALCASTGVLLWRRWDWLAVAAFVASVPQLVYWIAETYDDHLGRVLVVLTLFWLLYVVAAIGYELRVPVRTLRASSAALLLANAVLISAAGYVVLHERHHADAATAWVVAVALVHVVLGVVGFRGRMSNEIGALLVAVGIGLSAIGLALALSGPALVLGWSVEAVVLAWVARRTDERRAVAGVALFLVLAVAHVLLVEAPPEALLIGVDSLPQAVVGIALVALAALGISLLLPPAGNTWARPLLHGLVAVALVYLPSVAIVDTWTTGDASNPGQTPQLLLSALWGVIGLCALLAGLVRDERRLRLGGLMLLAIAVAKVFLFDLTTLESIYRVLSFIALGLLLLSAAFAYQRLRRTVQ